MISLSRLLPTLRSRAYNPLVVKQVETTFQITFTSEAQSRLRFVKIRSRGFLEARHYPVLTMLGQSLASVGVALECLILHIPDVYVDTTGRFAAFIYSVPSTHRSHVCTAFLHASTGAAFAYPLAKLIAGCKVVAYVHYPIISAGTITTTLSALSSPIPLIFSSLILVFSYVYIAVIVVGNRVLITGVVIICYDQTCWRG